MLCISQWLTCTLNCGVATVMQLPWHCDVVAACGGTLQESAGVFSSNFIQDNTVERKEQLCQWRISATHGEKIVLNITMLEIPESDNCEANYLEVRDGHWLKSNLLGKKGIKCQYPVQILGCIIHNLSVTAVLINRQFQ